jgi:hypothetical protein
MHGKKVSRRTIVDYSSGNLKMRKTVTRFHSAFSINVKAKNTFSLSQFGRISFPCYFLDGAGDL